jgi:hypothetical protein
MVKRVPLPPRRTVANVNVQVAAGQIGNVATALAIVAEERGGGEKKV